MTVGPPLLVVSLAERLDVCRGASAVLKNSLAAVAVFELFSPPPPRPSFPFLFPFLFPPLPPPSVRKRKNVKLSNCAVKLAPEAVTPAVAAAGEDGGADSAN